RRAWADQLRGNVNSSMNSHNEQPWPRLRQKTHGIHDKRTDPIAFLHERADNGGKIPAVVRRERPNDVLQNGNLWTPTSGDHGPHKLPKGLKCSTSLTGQTSAIPRK